MAIYIEGQLYQWWAEHPVVPVDEWIRAVQDRETRMGYWDYVKAYVADFADATISEPEDI